jgi:hypothetical protein
MIQFLIQYWVLSSFVIYICLKRIKCFEETAYTEAELRWLPDFSSDSCSASPSLCFTKQAVHSSRIMNVFLFLNLVLRPIPFPLSLTPAPPRVTPSTPPSSKVRFDLIDSQFQVPLTWDTRNATPLHHHHKSTWGSLLNAFEPYIRGPMGRCIKLPRSSSNLPPPPHYSYSRIILSYHSQTLSSKTDQCQHLPTLWKE